MTDFSKMIDALIGGDQDGVLEHVQAALDDGTAAEKILNEGLVIGMDVVGDKMQAGDMFIPEVLMSARSMSAALNIIKPLLGEGSSAGLGTIVIGTVKGDLHDIGKNLVSMMMEGAGFDVVDLGVDVPPERFVTAIDESCANIVALSALLTTTMPMMKQTIDALTESGMREKVKVLVGGAPVTQNFADDIGADGYAADAGSTSKLAKSLLLA